MSFILGIVAGGGIGGPLSSALQPVNQLISQQVFTALPTSIPSPTELINMRYREIITPEEYQTTMLKHGYTRELAEDMYISQKSLFAIGDIVRLHRRGLIEEEEYRKLALSAGYDSERLAIAEKATLAFPTANDVVRFSVREVYTPSVVEKFGMAEDLPDEYLAEAKKVGMSEELASQYWLAHWELPSVQMGYEMLHRGVISREELELLLKTADVMPFWRQKLIDISFNPVTRVDVRRLFKLGIYSEEQVKNAYKKIGYTDEDAEALTKFTKLNTIEQERDLTKAEVLKLYSFRELEKEKAQELLFRMGYDNDEADYLLDLEDMKLKDKDTKVRINFLQRQYASNKIDDFTLRDSLLKLNLNNENVERIVAQAEQQRKETIQFLSKADILNLYKAKIVDRETARNKLLQLSFLVEDVDLLLKSVEKAGGEKE